MKIIVIMINFWRIFASFDKFSKIMTNEIWQNYKISGRFNNFPDIASPNIGSYM